MYSTAYYPATTGITAPARTLPSKFSYATDPFHEAAAMTGLGWNAPVMPPATLMPSANLPPNMNWSEFCTNCMRNGIPATVANWEIYCATCGVPAAASTRWPMTAGYGAFGAAVPTHGVTAGVTGHPLSRVGNYYTSELGALPWRPASHVEYVSMLNPIRFDALGNRFFCCCFDMRGFRPEEIRVDCDLKERCIVVKGSLDSKDEIGHSVKRNYERKFYFPTDVKVDFSKLDFKCNLTYDGLLWVEASLPRVSLEEARSGMYSPMHGAYPYSTTAFPIVVKTGGESGTAAGRK